MGSDTLPLSVSRETVQQSASLKTIRKKLVRKTIDMIKKLADKEAAEEETKEEENEKKEEEEEEKKESGPVATYSDFWEKFSYSIKLGVIEDTANRNRLAKLLRFKTSASQGKAIGLEKYIQNMKDGQEKIFFVAAPTLAECEASPFTEALIKRGFEVIYFDTPVDEYVVAHMTEFDDIKLQNVAREDVKFGDEDEALEKRFEEAFSDLTVVEEDPAEGRGQGAGVQPTREDPTCCGLFQVRLEREHGPHDVDAGAGEQAKFHETQEGGGDLPRPPHHQVSERSGRSFRRGRAWKGGEERGPASVLHCPHRRWLQPGRRPVHQAHLSQRPLEPERPRRRQDRALCAPRGAGGGSARGHPGGGQRGHPRRRLDGSAWGARGGPQDRRTLSPCLYRPDWTATPLRRGARGTRIEKKNRLIKTFTKHLKQ